MKLKSFTLIELLIVVAITGILAMIAVPNFLNAMIKTKIARSQADINVISSALEMSFLDWQSYICCPSSYEAMFFKLTSPTSYISTILQDPFPEHRFSSDGTLNVWNHSYMYSYWNFIDSSHNDWHPDDNIHSCKSFLSRQSTHFILRIY